MVLIALFSKLLVNHLIVMSQGKLQWSLKECFANYLGYHKQHFSGFNNTEKS